MSLRAQGNTNPGRLDRRITIQYAVQARDGAGGQVPEWYDLATVSAAKVPVRGGRLYAAEARHFEALVGYRIRHRPGVAAGMRVVHGDDVLEIVAPPEELGRRQYLDLTCRGLDQTTGDNRALLNLGDGETLLDLGDGATPLDLGAAA